MHEPEGFLISPLQEEAIAGRGYQLEPSVEKDSRAMYHYLLGNMALDREDFDEALRNLSETSALLNDPLPSLHLKIAGLFLKEGKLEAAFQESLKAIEENPSNSTALLFHAGILESLQKHHQ